MSESRDESIEQLMLRFREKRISRSRFMAALAGLGASATGIATLISSAEAAAANAAQSGASVPESVGEQNKQLHHEHIERRRRGMKHHRSTRSLQSAHVREVVDDYADHAVIEHPLLAAPIAGKAAIAAYKQAELNSMAGTSIEVKHRYAHGNQVVAEWVWRGTHERDFMGFPAKGRRLVVHGVTVVTRENGKITRESLHYDVADVRRQLTGRG